MTYTFKFSAGLLCLALSIASPIRQPCLRPHPTLEDAGYAYEASERCSDIAIISTTTRKLERSSRFRDGRRMFRSAVEQWGNNWACNTALENLGPEVDLSDYYTGRRVVQPPPEDIPPLPTFKASIISNLTSQTTE